MLSFLLRSVLLLLPACSPVSIGEGDETLASREHGFVRRPSEGFLVLREHYGPFLLRKVVLGYDWNRESFRAAVKEGEPHPTGAYTFRSSEISREDFERVLDGVLEMGLASLPLENPSGGSDIYELNTTLGVYHRDVAWENTGRPGCVVHLSSTKPSDAERKKFAEIVGFVFRTVDSLPMAEGSVLDEHSVVLLKDPLEQEAFRIAVEHARREPFFHELDRNRFCMIKAGLWSVSFGLRGMLRSSDPNPCAGWPGSYGVQIDMERVEVTNSHGVRPKGLSEDRARRETFVAEHAELSRTLRELIQEGWVQEGMTKEMVVAAWGDPTHTYNSGWSYKRRTNNTLRFEEDILLKLR